MTKWTILLAAALPILLLSCRHTPPPAATTPPVTPDGKLAESLKSAEHREVLKAASQRLDDVRKALKSGDIAAAEAGLQPLQGQGLFEGEVNELRGEIRAAKDKVALEVSKKEADRRALTEVDQRYTLPTNYGSTVTIDGQPGSLAVPPGPMEELFKRKVDISVQNAGVNELVQALTQIEGLNIIADDALEAKKALTVNVKNTPLSEILSYIARNMGIAFHLGENVVWVTQSEEEPGAGPKLETQVYRLREGFVPTLKPRQKEGGEGGGGGGAEDTDLEDAIESIMADSPEGASYRVFRNRNLLMVRNSRENLRLIEKLIEDFDKPPQQVLIEARFLTVGKDDLRDIGVELSQLAHEHDPGPFLEPIPPEPVPGQDSSAYIEWLDRVTEIRRRNYDASKATVYPNALKAAGEPDSELSDFLTQLGALKPGSVDGLGALTISGIIGNRAYGLMISALDKKGSTHTLSAPRITVLNNQTARIRKGDKLLYYDELDSTAADGGAAASGSSADAGGQVQTAFTGTPKELELGVTLEVKVSIGNDGRTVLMGLQPEVIDLKRWRAFTVVAGGGGNASNNVNNGTAGTVGIGQIELPETTESVANTTVAVKSGETVVLGGMMKSIAQTEVTKIPLLGDIPWIGFLFRHTKETDQPQHLLIFVTATVIDPSGRFVKVREAAQ